MASTHDDIIAGLQRASEELRRERDERGADRDAALAREAALADVLAVINRSPTDPGPVYDTILEKARVLCGAEMGILSSWDGEYVVALARHGYPDAVSAMLGRIGQPFRPGLGHAPVLRGERFSHVLDVTEMVARPGEDEEVRAYIEQSGTRTWLLMPLRRDDALVGFISVARRAVRAFSAAEIAMLESLAAQAVIAMENARLLGELRERTAELAERNSAFGERIEQQSATIEVLKQMSASPGDAQPVFELICLQAKTLLDVEAVSLFEYDGRLVHLRASPGTMGTLETAALAAYKSAFPMAPDRGSLTCRAILDGTMIHIRDLEPEPGISQGVRDLGHKTQVTIPLMRDRHAIGAITTASLRVDGISSTQIELLKTFGEQAVIAITSAETYRALQERTAALAQRNSEFGERIEQQAATIDVLKVMSSTPGDTQPVFDQIVTRARELCNCFGAGLYVYDGELVHLGALTRHEVESVDAKFRELFPRPLTREMASFRAILDGRTHHIRDLDADPDINPVARGTIKSSLAVPMLRDGGVIGCVTINSREKGGFTDSQIALLQTFAEQAVIAITSVANFRALRERTAELAQRQEELRVTFENMGDGVAMFDGTQNLVAWNRKFQDILEVPDEIIAQRRSLPDYIRYLAERGEFGRDADVEDQVRRVLDTTGQMRAFERMRPNGRVIEIHSNPIAGGGFVLIYSDITERKRNEAEIAAARDAAQEAARTIEAAFRELKIAQANLIQAEKMASLGQLTAGIAHEIKNPLNFVNNFASLSVDLLAELKEAAAPGFAALTEDQRAEIDDISQMLTSNLQKISEHGKRADGIVKAMLEHSRGASGERREVDINALADEALNLAYHGARAQDQSFNIALDREFGDGIAPIEVNPQDITRVFLNLFSNGFYAANMRARDDGSPDFKPTLKVTTQEAGGGVEIRVRDNGTGIPADIRDKLFQPFFTTKPTGEGTGLGLSITYDIITKAHGGTISVDSGVDEFTEFIVTLPRVMFTNESNPSMT